MISYKSDIWALGNMLFYFRTHEHPFTNDPKLFFKRLHSDDYPQFTHEIWSLDEELEILYQEAEVKRIDRLNLDVIYHYDTNVFYESIEEQGLITTYSTDDYIIGYTPHGKELTLTIVNSAPLTINEINNLRNKALEEHPNAIELNIPTSGMNCFNYAFYTQNLDCNYRIQSVDIYNFLDQNLYVTGTSTEIPSPGDIIIYYEDSIDENSLYLGLHFAIVESNPNNRTLNSEYRNEIIVTSKWGEDGGVYRHAINDYGKSNNSVYQTSFEYNYKLIKLNVDDTCQLSSNTTSFNDNLSLTQKPNDGPVKSNYGLYKINITNPGLYSFSFNSSYPLDVRLYDYSLGDINYEPTKLKFISGLGYTTHLDEGTYHLYFQLKNQNISTQVSFSIYNRQHQTNGIIVDPGSDWLCGTQITMYDALYATDGATYNNNIIVEGFTRIIYFDNSIVNELSRLDYYYISSDENIAIVTDYGTVVAKNTDTTKQVTIYAINKDNPGIVYAKQFIVVPYQVDEIIVIHLEDEININESIYIELDELVPFKYLQCYEWESLNEEIATVNYIGQVTGVSTGTTQLIGTYKYNSDVVIIITINVD